MDRTQRMSLGFVGVIFGALSIWAIVTGSIGVAAAERETSTAADLLETGRGVSVTAEMTGVEPHRAGRRAGITFCPNYKYETQDGQAYMFREKRLCEPHWFRAGDAELVYEIAAPEKRYWAEDFERKPLAQSANSTRTLGTWGAVLTAVFGLAVVLWPVRKRSGQS